MIDKHSRTHQTREIFAHKKSALLSTLATTGRKVLLSDGTVSYKTVSTSHIDLNIARSADPVAKLTPQTVTT